MVGEPICKVRIMGNAEKTGEATNVMQVPGGQQARSPAQQDWPSGDCRSQHPHAVSPDTA